VRSPRHSTTEASRAQIYTQRSARTPLASDPMKKTVAATEIRCAG
jgi:hypothetical protein